MEYVEKALALLRAMGLPGLFLLALVDAAGIPTGGGPDLLILVQATQARGPAEVLVITLAAILGSTLGCLFFYALGRRGGRPVLARFSAAQQERLRDQIELYGLWVIVVAVFAPPPYPMKPFVLAAGVFRMPLKTFAGGVLLGRILRYGAVGYLALRYGQEAGALLRTHYPTAVVVLLALALFFLVARWWRRRAGNGARPAEP